MDAIEDAYDKLFDHTSKEPFAYSVISFILGGTLFACGVLICVSSLWQLWFYIGILALVHEAEFLFVAMYHKDDLSTDSFLLNHSFGYSFSVLLSVTEFLIEWPIGLKGFSGSYLLQIIGIVLTIVGVFFRIASEFTAGRSFSHIIASKHKEHHILIIHGVYSIVRHPGYFGWFFSSIGLQLVLLNPLSLVVYIVVYWRFFDRRITFEEKSLVEWFGDDYLKYRERTSTGIPFIR